jgi:hypothetical protein
MNFDVDVTDQALDALPQDLPFGALDKLIEALEERLAHDPIARSRRAIHPRRLRPGNVYFDGFEFDGDVYLFRRLFLDSRGAGTGGLGHRDDD